MSAHHLEAALNYCRRYLPRQGRLEDFIHHNTLHAFTDRSFDDAVCEASTLYGSKPYPTLRYFHGQFARGRIDRGDLFKIIEEEVPGVLNRDLQVGGANLTGEELVEILMLDARFLKLQKIYHPGSLASEKVYHKWHPLLSKYLNQGKLNDIIPNLYHRNFFPEKSRIFYEAFNETNGLILRCLSAFFDQGVSKLSLPERQFTLLRFFFTYTVDSLPLASNWRKILSKNITFYQENSSQEIILNSLKYLGISPKEWSHYLFFMLYKFKGWSAFILATANQKQDGLADFAAILILCELSKIQDFYKSDTQTIQTLGRSFPTMHPVRKHYESNVQTLVKYLLDKKINTQILLHLNEEELLPLLEICIQFHNFFKRKVFQKALDQKSERNFLGAVLASKNQDKGYLHHKTPQFIALFCIDEREESFRRHLEECAPNLRTESTAGHFGLNIEFQAYRRSHYRKLCPVTQTADIHVKEVVSPEDPNQDQMLDRLGKAIHLAEQALLHPIYGSLVTLFFSPILLFLLFLRIYFSGFYLSMKKKWLKKQFKSETPSTFLLETENLQSIANTIYQIFIACGLKNIEAPYFFVVGHGSTSLNNPHEAAHDCGACGGGRGWPNAKLFSDLCNRHEIQKILLEFGIHIHSNTYFVGAYHNTCSDDVEFMNLPTTISTDLKSCMEIFKQASIRHSVERARRFLDISMPKNLSSAKSAMILRSIALSQVRPEYGHATNAYLVIAPRLLTRGLFMDRRCFLCSYDFQNDSTGDVLKSILSQVLPVCLGINLEYYFSTTDQRKYGCDTKIPHNINGLNSVINGYMSDLLLGLPIQMTEIHEPIKLKVLIEAPPDVIQLTLKNLPEIYHELENEWFCLAALDPSTRKVFSWKKGNFHTTTTLPTHWQKYTDSLHYILSPYHHVKAPGILSPLHHMKVNRGFLDFALIRKQI